MHQNTCIPTDALLNYVLKLDVETPETRLETVQHAMRCQRCSNSILAVMFAMDLTFMPEKIEEEREGGTPNLPSQPQRDFISTN